MVIHTTKKAKKSPFTKKFGRYGHTAQKSKIKIKYMSQLIQSASSFFEPRSLQGLLNGKVNRQLILQILSAFFVVFILSITLQKTIERQSGVTVPQAATVTEEASAYIPGQYVSAQISNGYIGNY